LQTESYEDKEYVPAEDTFFLADFLETQKGKNALDLGTGSGYLGKILSRNFSLVVGTDISFDVLNHQNSKLSNLVCCNGADAICGKFDLIACNFPYLPSETISDRTVDGGHEGVEIPMKIIDSAIRCVKDHGKFIFLTSSLAKPQKLISYMNNHGFSTRIVGCKKLFFEEIILVEAIKKSK